MFDKAVSDLHMTQGGEESACVKQSITRTPKRQSWDSQSMWGENKRSVAVIINRAKFLLCLTTSL